MSNSTFYKTQRWQAKVESMAMNGKALKMLHRTLRDPLQLQQLNRRQASDGRRAGPPRSFHKSGK
jgi:hypothetical protein